MATLFEVKAPRIMKQFMLDLPIGLEDSAAIVGNFGHETGGFRHMQELKPVVPGSRGGYGLAQWTGPRRRLFEKWCKRKGWAPSSDQANYSFAFRELKTTEKHAIDALRRAVGLRAKVVAFERAYERAGHKAYDSRVKYAQIALAAYQRNPNVAPILATPAAPKPAREAPRGFREVLVGLGAALAALIASALIPAPARDGSLAPTPTTIQEISNAPATVTPAPAPRPRPRADACPCR